MLAGRDILVIMPTGGGKSLCYAVPAVVRPGVALIVCPLIAVRTWVGPLVLHVHASQSHA